MLSTALFAILGLLTLDQVWQQRQRLGRLAWVGAGIALVGFVGAVVSLPSLLYLQKVAALVVMPIGLVWCGLLGAATVYRVVGRNGPALVFLAAFFGLGLAANPWLGRTLLAELEAPYAGIDAYAAGPFDVVFVMGGGTSLDGHGRPILGGSGDRVMLGARLWHAGRVETLVPSGSSIAGIGRSRDVARETELIWDAIDVPDEVVEPIAAPRNSSEEIQAYKALADENGWSRMGLVTSAWHMRRVMKLADRYGLEVEALPADFRGSRGFDGVLSFIPTGPGARDMHRVGWEYLGALMGR